MIHVLAEIGLAAGARDAFIAEFQRLAPLVQAEAGCIEYHGAVEVQTSLTVQLPVRPHVFTVVEKWSDEAALARHLEEPHMHEHWSRAAGLTTGTTIRVLRPV